MSFTNCLRAGVPAVTGIVLSSGLAHPALALPAGFHETTAVTGLSQPTALAFAPDGRLFINEQCGRIRLVKGGHLLATPFATIKTDCRGERGILGIALDPHFMTNGFVYVYHTVPASPRFNRLARLTVDPANPNVAGRGSYRPLMDLNRLSSATNHNGGGIHFGKDSQLYIGVGENANSNNAQSLNTRLGKILRINSNGSIPSDNPFFTTASGYNRAIWAYGLRNPFTFAVDPSTGTININDVGQDRREEINRGKAGSNYGWPICEGTCSAAGLTNPIYQYTHNGGSAAVTGGAFNRGRQFPTSYAGDYFFGDYLQGFINYLAPNGQVVNFQSRAKSPVDLAFGPNGKLYYLSIGRGALYRISFGP